MADAPTQPVEGVTPPAPVAKPIIDIKQSASSQADKLIEIYKSKGEEPKPDEPTEPKEEPKKEEPKPEEPKEVPTPPTPVELEPDDEPLAKPVDLGPLEKFVSSKLPTLTTVILDADNNPKTVQFKDPAELGNFTLANDSVRGQFTIDVAAQVARTKDAIAEYNNAQMQQNIRNFEVTEAQDIASDLARLQKAGMIPEFKYDIDDPNFRTDPAVKIADEIEALYRQTNAAYARKYAGTPRTFRISYADAADKYFAAQGRTSANESQVAKDQPTEPKPKEKTPAQKEREEVARQTGSDQGGEPSNAKPRATHGMRMDDINRLVRAGRI